MGLGTLALFALAACPSGWGPAPRVSEDMVLLAYNAGPFEAGIWCEYQGTTAACATTCSTYPLTLCRAVCPRRMKR
jgi:hypothetical protein